MKLTTATETITDLSAIRHYFHQHPELSSQEYQTTALIKAYLADLGYTIITPEALQTGVIAEIGPEDAQHTVALRADIDALPIQEQTNLDFASENAGTMHACGHDFHLTSLLGAAEKIKENADKLTVKVRLIFQPAEETHVGAEQVIASGGLEDVDVIVGYHNHPNLPVGQISVGNGGRNAAVDQFAVKLTGVGGHAAKPHENIDPILALASTVTALQSIVSRSLDPYRQSVLSVTHIEGGQTWNVIPDSTWFEGTIRTFGDHDRERAKEKFYQIINGQAATYGVSAEIEWIPGPPVLGNDPILTDILAENIQYHANLVNFPPSAGGEDFAFYTSKVPSVFAEIGSGGNSGLHHSDLVLDDAGLETAINWYYQSVLRLQDYFVEKGEEA